MKRTTPARLDDVMVRQRHQPGGDVRLEVDLHYSALMPALSKPNSFATA
ncbi:hypothetical protein [Hoeflea alexandrii]